MATSTIERSDWDLVVAAFRGFFGSAGDVIVETDGAWFRAEITGFNVGRDGTSEAFMPLHSTSMRWDRIEFDDRAWEVRLQGDAGTYTYVLPPDLRPRR